MIPTCTVTPEVGQAAGSLIVQALTQAIDRRGRARLAIPGGRSPAPVFRWLATHLPAEVAARLTVTWVDDRHLADIDLGGPWEALPPESNVHTAWRDGWSHAPAERRPARIVPLAASGSLHEAHATVQRRFADEVGEIDVVLLGAGPDGHIASLFAGHPALKAAGPVIAVPDSPKPPPERLTLSMSVLQAVDCAVLVAQGDGRAAMLRAAYAGDPALPLAQYTPRGAWHWVLDPLAAAELPAEKP